MAVVAFAKKSIALALAAGSVYASHRSGVWGTADESKKAWNDAKASIATTTNRSNLLPFFDESYLTMSHLEATWNRGIEKASSTILRECSSSGYLAIRFNRGAEKLRDAFKTQNDK